jgi:hypothetical protein
MTDAEIFELFPAHLASVIKAGGWDEKSFRAGILFAYCNAAGRGEVQTSRIG